MPFNGSGTFIRVMNWTNDALANIRIRADRHDQEDDNLAQGLSQCITKDGQTTVTNNLPMANYRHTNVGAAQGVNQYARYDQVQLGKAVWAVAGGTSDAITATYSPNTIEPIDGQLYYVRATAANATTTPTFSPDGNTAQVITKYGAEALAVGDISGAGHELILRYRLADTKYELLNPFCGTFKQSISITGTTTESAFIDLFEDTDNGTNKVKFQAPQLLANDITVTLPDIDGTLLLASQVPIIRNFIDGYQMSTAGASTTMTIGGGQASDSTNSVYLTGVSISKTTSAWAVGTGNGGLDTGSIANNTWYHFYAIRRPDTGVVDVIFSTNASAPTLPTNYTQYRTIGSGRTNASGQWEPFTQNGNLFLWSTPVVDVNASALSSSALTKFKVPTGKIVRPKLHVTIGMNGLTANSGLYAAIGSATASSSLVEVCSTMNSANNSQASGSCSQFLTNTNGQLYYALVGGLVPGLATGPVVTTPSGPSCVIKTAGWVDLRGQE